MYLGICMITISARQLGKRKNLFDDYSIPLPPSSDDGSPWTLRKLIIKIVRTQVEAFRGRQMESRRETVLTAVQIQKAATRGKVAMGGRSFNQTVDPASAVENALQAFKDGMYLVMIDGAEQRSLDANISVTEQSRVTFIRLVFLAGA